MLKKTITYESFDGETITEDFYFNVSKAELIELELSQGKDGFEAFLKKLIEAEDAPKIIDQMKSIVLMSVGEKSLDGKRFIKNDEIRERFEQTNAYSDLFLELATNAESAVEFVKGILPSSISEELDKVETETVELPQPEQKRPQDMTREELLAAMQERNSQ